LMGMDPCSLSKSRLKRLMSERSCGHAKSADDRTGVYQVHLENPSSGDPNNHGVRINKYLADTGYCSRREADRLIAEGHVTLDDAVAQVGSRVLPGQTVRVYGEPVLPDEDLVYLALYKPVGITTTTDSRRGDNIIDFLKFPKRIFPIGRLDRDSEGLIFLTNDGAIVNKVLRAGNRHEKEYRVKVDRPSRMILSDP